MSFLSKLLIVLSFFAIANRGDARDTGRPIPPISPVTVDNIIKRINEAQIKDLSDLLRHLPDSYFEQSAFVFKSQSAQEASFQAPRVILFGRPILRYGKPYIPYSEGQFDTTILAFNGEPDQEGYFSLEMMEFDRQEKEFNFREITFPENQNGEVVVTKKNPRECLRCHGGESPRPNWDVYDKWPGVYGLRSHHDDPPPVINKFKKFVKVQENNPRYTRVLKHARPDQNTVNNVALSRNIATFNAERLAKFIMSTPDYQKYKYVIIAAMECEETFSPEDFIPSSRSLKEFSVETHELLRGVSFPFPDSVANVRYIFEGRGISMRDWSTVFGETSYNLASPDYGIKDVGHALMRMDPELKANIEDDFNKCENARKKVEELNVKIAQPQKK